MASSSSSADIRQQLQCCFSVLSEIANNITPASLQQPPGNPGESQSSESAIAASSTSSGTTSSNATSQPSATSESHSLCKCPLFGAS